jgi:hypothetical protein
MAVPWLRRLVAASHRGGLGSTPGYVMCDLCGQNGTGAGFLRVFRFRLQFSFHRLLNIHHLSSGAGTIGQLVTDVPSGLSLTPPQKTKKEKTFGENFYSILQDENEAFQLVVTTRQISK